MAWRAITLSVALLVCCSSCRPADSTPTADVELKSLPSQLIVCFNLQSSAAPAASIIDRRPPPQSPKWAHVVVPIGSTDLVAPRSSPFASGNSPLHSVFAYGRPAGGLVDGDGLVCSFRPRFAKATISVNDTTNLQDSTDCVYFEKSGLTHFFVYRNPARLAKPPDWLGSLASLGAEAPALLALVLPADSEGREIRQTKQTTVPLPVASLGGARLFDLTMSPGGDVIEVEYSVPATPLAKNLQKYGLKLLALALIPTLALLVSRPSDATKLKRWRIGMVFGLVIQGVLIASLFVQGIRNIELGGAEFWWELIVTIIGAVYVTLIAIAKSK